MESIISCDRVKIASAAICQSVSKRPLSFHSPYIIPALVLSFLKILPNFSVYLQCV